MIASLNAQFVRLAYPIRSSAFAELADTDADREALASLMEPQGAPPSMAARSYVLAPFLHPVPSRFSDGSYGVLYAADSLKTAVMEKVYHLSRFFSDAHAPAQSTRQTHLALQLVGKVRDVRRARGKTTPRGIYHATDYSAAQKFGRSIHESAAGVHYDSVRNADAGHCIGAFVAGLVRRARITGDVDLVWDGARFTEQHLVEHLDY